jgi:hypothetical protein
MKYPKPTSPMPSFEELEEQNHDCIVECTDGCFAEPDGECEHGYPSWLLQLGVI